MPGKFPTGDYRSVCGELVMCGHIPDGYEASQAEKSRPHSSNPSRGQQCSWPAPAQCPQ